MASQDKQPEVTGDEDRIGKLATEAGELLESVVYLNKALSRNRKLAAATAVGLVLDVVLTIVLATVLSGQANTNKQIKESLRENYVTSQQQAQTRVKVLCPLYEVLLASASVQPPAPNSTVEKARADAIKTIKQGYVALECQPKLP
jgi:hypothetical protein